MLAILLSLAPVGASAQLTNGQNDNDVQSTSPLPTDSTTNQGQQPYVVVAPPSGANASVPEPTQIGNSGTNSTTTTNNGTNERPTAASGNENIIPSLRQPAKPNEFEKYIEDRLGKVLPRFGADLVVPSSRDFTVPATTTIPSSYVLQPGDTVFIGLSGSVDGSIERTIDNNGNIFLEKVGSVHLAGIRYADLKTAVERALGTQYRGFYVSVSVTKLHGIQVYVTGYANHPGSFTVNSLSTLLNAVLAAGGPSSGGSFRSIELFRNGELVTKFDLYDLILSGDKSKDVLLQNQDVIRIDPLGEQVAVTGSVNQEAIYEAKPGEKIADIIRYAGGFNGLADKSRVILYRLSEADKGGIEIPANDLPEASVNAGDIIQILSVGSLARPLEKQSILVRIDGEVEHPGNYYVSPGTTLGQAMSLAGGLTQRAYVYGTVFERQSVRLQQRASFNEAVRQLELSLSAAPLTSEDSSDAVAQRQLAAATDVVRRLRAAQPNGRVVLPIAYAAPSLPGDIVLENNDAIHIPPRPTTVGVFGAVYRPASFLLRDGGRRVKDYLDDAGGPIKAADKGQIFLVRANGEVVSKHRDVMGATVYPGDVIFVPVKTHGSRFWQHFRDVSQFVFGASISAATVTAITR
jgi:protein involved in polysaccharide export with SLBB domain